MSACGADLLELLLPEADEGRRAQARRLTTFLRLVSNAASPRRAESVGLRLEGARCELESATRERLLAALCDLVAHHLAAVRDPASFLDLGEPRHSHQAAWSTLEEERAELPELPHVPSPGERPLEVASRLLAGAERLGLDGARAAAWRACCSRLSGGPREGEGAFGELLQAALRRGAKHDACAALAGAVECLLDRAAVGAAAALLAEHAALREATPRLRLLDGWTRLLSGDESGAAALLEGRDPLPRRVPGPLVALRARSGSWARWLRGRPARGRPARPARIERRGDVGAALMAVFALEDAGAIRAVHLDCAPALRASLDPWLEDRDGACRRVGELERELVLCGEPVSVHGEVGRAPRGALEPRTIRAVALAPVIASGGELLGWLRLEFEHHLVPAPAQLSALGRAWRGALDAARAERGSARVAPEREALPLAPAPRDDPRAQVFLELVEALGFKTAQRRWWGIVADEAGWTLAGCEGGALEAWGERPGGAQGLRRALVSAGPVRFDEPDAALAIAADAASGLVVPIVHRGAVQGLLAVESTRRRDLAGLDAGLEELSARRGPALRAAHFRRWQRERFGGDVHIDVGVPSSAALIEDVVAAARAPGPVTLSGPAGSGKLVLARWLHFESGRGGEPLVVHACGAREALAEERELFGAEAEAAGRMQLARAGTLVLDDPERLAPATQARLERWLADERRDPRLVLTCRNHLGALLAAGRLREGLARRLQRLELDVPGLAERREDVPGLARQLAGRFARELGHAAPSFSDEALALLWRQPWLGNVRELENVVYKLVLLGGDPLEPAHVEAVARRFRLELVQRIAPREADRPLIEAALRTTRTKRATANKTRAALYLGWDPDTLARRIADEAIDPAIVLGAE